MRTVKQKALATIAAIAKDYECEAVLNDLAPRGETEILVQQGWTSVAKVTFTFGGTGAQVYVAARKFDAEQRPSGWRKTAKSDKVMRSIRWSDGYEVAAVFDFIRARVDAAAER